MPPVLSAFANVQALAGLRDIARLADRLNGRPHAEAVCDIASMCQDSGFRVVVFGEFSVGKSTLINALFGRNALPAKAMPTTGPCDRDPLWGR